MQLWGVYYGLDWLVIWALDYLFSHFRNWGFHYHNQNIEFFLGSITWSNVEFIAISLNDSLKNLFGQFIIMNLINLILLLAQKSRKKEINSIVLLIVFLYCENELHYLFFCCYDNKQGMVEVMAYMDLFLHLITLLLILWVSVCNIVS